MMEFTFKKIVKTELVGCRLCKNIYFRPNRTDLLENHLKNEHKIKLDDESDGSEENLSPKLPEIISVKAANKSLEQTGSLKKPVLTAGRSKHTPDTIPVSPIESKTSTAKPKNRKRKLSALSQLKQEKGLI